MHLLQVCNVGSILGGTAACAWTVTRALPDVRHSIAFLGKVDAATRSALAPAQVWEWDCVDSKHVAPLRPDIILLHNTSPRHARDLERWVTVQYAHSSQTQFAADRLVYCSSWLREQFHAKATQGQTPTPVASQPVLYQAVPRPPTSFECPDRSQRNRLVIGRICTPTRRKWPDTLRAFYTQLATAHPHVDWEFIGCPREMEGELHAACQGRAGFFPAGWQARSRLWHWDALLYHHPTLTESFGRTVAEALRCGCIPIVDNRGGFCEQVATGTGFLCDDTADFSEAVRVIHDPQTRRAMSLAAQTHGDTHFSLARFRQDLLHCFQQTTGPR